MLSRAPRRPPLSVWRPWRGPRDAWMTPPPPVSSGRSNKGTVGNCVTTMVHNHYTPPERAPPPKSSNHTAPSLK